MIESIRTKYRTTLLGFFGSLTFALLCVFLYLIDKGELILLMLYIPGAIFGITMATALNKYCDNFSALFLLAGLEYVAMLFFYSKDFEYLALRRVLMGGLGAILFLQTVRLITTIKLDLKDYFIGFAVGIATTIFIWTDNFESFNTWLTILSIVLWQTLIAAIINRRQLTLDKI